MKKLLFAPESRVKMQITWRGEGLDEIGYDVFWKSGRCSQS